MRLESVMPVPKASARFVIILLLGIVLLVGVLYAPESVFFCRVAMIRM
ncbi:hypothetical protein BDD41_1824 [Paracoccus versutus]|uniref:Uncharacterized protein n=1 Tax=Paracoccus versutus TaxID=34007 RepID=A0A3D9XS65_PARVE|nr:hypothetical protein BDD41_1824 [Paracoccus versutus]